MYDFVDIFRSIFLWLVFLVVLMVMLYDKLLLEDDEEIKICGNLRWIVDDDFSFVRVNFKYYILL